VEEAKGAFTRRDFANRYALILRESRETQYWLRLVQETELVDRKLVTPLLEESTELVAILTVAARNARKPAPPPTES
jgi:four helix bundle protein